MHSDTYFLIGSIFRTGKGQPVSNDREETVISWLLYNNKKISTSLCVSHII